MNSLLQSIFCLLEPSGKVISEWPVMPGYPQNHAPGLHLRTFLSNILNIVMRGMALSQFQSLESGYPPLNPSVRAPVGLGLRLYELNTQFSWKDSSL